MYCTQDNPEVCIEVGRHDKKLLFKSTSQEQTASCKYYVHLTDTASFRLFAGSKAVNPGSLNRITYTCTGSSHIIKCCRFVSFRRLRSYFPTRTHYVAKWEGAGRYKNDKF